MKEIYFTHKNLDTKAKKMLAQINNTINVRKSELLTQSSALLVIDMQEFFLDKNSHAFIPSAPAIISNINNLINLYSKANLPVIFTKHINTPSNAILMRKWWNDILTQENPLSNIISEFNTLNNIVISKTQYDSFYKTNLETILIENNIKQIVITGVMTHLCCETTARSAFTRGFESFIAVDGTATYNETFHTSSLLNLSHGFSVPVLTSTIMESFNE